MKKTIVTLLVAFILAAAPVGLIGPPVKVGKRLIGPPTPAPTQPKDRR